MSGQQGIGKFVKPLLRRLGINVDGSSASALRLLGQLSWPTRLGAITHIQGPTDQNLTLAAAAGRDVAIRGALADRLSVSATTGVITINTFLVPNADATRDLGTSSLRWRYVYAAGGTVPSVLHKSVTSAQTGNNTDETTLWSYSLPAGTLASDGQAIRITAFGDTASNTNSKTIRLKFGGTTLATRVSATSGSNWYVRATVFRTGATAQQCPVDAYFTSLGIGVPTASETLADAVTIAVTGTNGTASAGDVVFRGAIVEFLP